MIEPIKLKSTFLHCEIQDGDIIAFQRDLSSKEANELKDHNLRMSIPQHYDYIANRMIVEFRPKNDQDGSLQTYLIELTKKSTYDQVAGALAAKLGTDPMHIQFTSASSPNGLPKHVLKRATNMLLHEMLSGNVPPTVVTNILYYEKLNISIVELESKRLFKVTWLGPTLKDEVQSMLSVKTLCN
jgi:ubiquitin carboxyl-terminal hydrolase 7